MRGKLVKTIVEPAIALEKSGVEGKILSFVASWHRSVNAGKEIVDMAQFDFLLSNNKKPVQVEVSYENGRFETRVKDLSREMGSVEEEEKLLDMIKLKTDTEIVEVLERDPRIENLMKRAKHLRLFSLSFLLFDEEFEAPVWKAVLKNWPLTNYFREEPVTVEAVIRGDGKLLQIRKII